VLEAGAAIVAAAAVFVGAATLLGVFGEGRSRRVASRAEALERRIRDDDGTALSILKEDPVSGRRPVTGLIARWRWATRRAALLDAADVPLKVSECLLVQALLFVALFGLAGLVSGIWLIGLAFGAAGVVAFELWIRSRAKRRLQSFNRQLPMALQIMSTSLRSGFGIMEAVQAVAREMDRPLSDEFR
jgi:Flp pilus assembly protein TadB